MCVGAIAGAHGVRGAVRIKSFTDDPAAIGGYGPVEDEAAARRFKLRVVGQAKGLVIAALDGVSDRDAAERLKGVKLYVARERLPETGEDEYLVADLVGLRAEDPEGVPLGRVSAVHDFGAGEILEVALAGKGSLMLPFTTWAVPVVDVAGGRVVVQPPPEAAGDEDDEGGRGGND